MILEQSGEKRPIGIILDRPGQTTLDMSRETLDRNTVEPVERDAEGRAESPSVRYCRSTPPSHAMDSEWLTFDQEHKVLPDVEGQTVDLSISHDGDYAVATCIVPTEQPHETIWQSASSERSGPRDQ